jgi:hypothetical protein
MAAGTVAIGNVESNLIECVVIVDLGITLVGICPLANNSAAELS